jgi:hypothetical protein
MLMEPASKVSVPLLVVITTRSSVPEREINPADVVVLVVFDRAKTPLPVQELDVKLQNAIEPYIRLAALAVLNPNPVV